MSRAAESATNFKEELSDTESTENCKKCGKPCDPKNKPSLHCNGGCDQRIHIECLEEGCVRTPLEGDVFFDLICASCSTLGEETVERSEMSWFSIIVLTLYNLREKSIGISKREYFHYFNNIGEFVKKNFKKKCRDVKNDGQLKGTISGILSHNKKTFKSGTDELGEEGYWKLLEDDPPEVLIAKKHKLNDKKKHIDSKLSSKSLNSPAPSDFSISVQENCKELFKNKASLVYSHAYVKPTETLSDYLFEEDEPNDVNFEDVDVEDDTMLHDENEVPFMSDLMRQNENTFYLTQLMDDCDWDCNTSSLSSKDTDAEVKTVEEEGYDEESNDSFIRKKPPVSLFNETKRRPRPWSKPLAATDNKIERMTNQEELYLLQTISKTNLSEAPSAVKRLHRKLAVRKIKREYQLPLLDVDRFGSKLGKFTMLSKDNGRVLDRFFSDDLGCVFEQRLQGYNEPMSVHSPYTKRELKPFIRRDTSCQPLWLRIMEELCAKTNGNNPRWKPLARAPIDYSYIRPQHIPAINSLCRQFFWPDIDLTECLQYPDFTCVVLYKKLVIGFAILVPSVSYNEAYISFLLTRPEWRKSGIGTFMLYHLIQTCMGQDITLHVSVTNPALILYQKFGFKVEEFIQDFYDKYMPPNSRECRHALFLRLSR